MTVFCLMHGSGQGPAGRELLARELERRGPSYRPGVEVEYWVVAGNASGRERASPRTAPRAVHRFRVVD